MLESLTPEQDALCDAVAEEYLKAASTMREPDPVAIRKWLEVVYRLYDMKVPERIEIVASPFAALDLGEKLTGKRVEDTNGCGYGDAGWTAYYDAHHRLGVLSAEEVADTLALRDFQRCAWDTLLLDECAIVVRLPVELNVDAEWNMHSSTGPALKWADGHEEYAWHGTWVDKRVVMDPRSYTREEYLAITNTEVRRALSESGGWEWVASLLDAKVINSWTDPVTGLLYELLAGGEEKFLRKQSPALKEGAQPTYIEKVHEELVTAQAARKWQAVPSLSPAECEKDPVLTYGVEA